MTTEYLTPEDELRNAFARLNEISQQIEALGIEYKRLSNKINPTIIKIALEMRETERNGKAARYE